MFKTELPDQQKSRHLFYNGLERIDTVRGLDYGDYRLCVPEIVQKYSNPCITTLKRPLWRQLLALLGSEGDTIFANLLLDCTIFEHLAETGSYYQICGCPMHQLLTKTISPVTDRKPGEISIVRSRILYSKPSLNRGDGVSFGLRRFHILNRINVFPHEQQDRVMLQYIFPRQFKLHNVFTSKVDRTETTQPFKDYTLREDVSVSADHVRNQRIPARLFTTGIRLVRRIRKRYKKCRIDQLVYHYCPLKQIMPTDKAMLELRCKAASTNTSRTSIPPLTQHYSTVNIGSLATSGTSDTEDCENSLLPYVASSDQVSAFCRAVLRRLLPADAFGAGEDGASNWSSILSHVHHFVHLRRYETVSLHELSQGLRLKAIVWLFPTDKSRSGKLSSSDKKKREELLHEFLYYIFDSLLMPLIATNFYVTESGVHRNKLLYFRHDIWMRLCRPHLESVKLGSLLPVSKTRLRELAGAGHTSYSVIRLLPKEKGIRTITNLKRRAILTAGGKRTLDVSINTRLEPVFRVLQYEKKRVEREEAFTFDGSDLHRQLASFKAHVDQGGDTQFYFVKVDIKSAFDSIPQRNLLDLVETLFQHEDYAMTKHAAIKMLAENSSENPSAKYGWLAGPTEIAEELVESEDQALLTKKHVIYVDAGKRYSISSIEAKKRLHMHVLNNIIKIGHKYRKSAQGIPQGSILSSFLCNFFYDHFEKTKLSFLRPQSSLLLRVIDDFLLITTDKTDAMQFVTTMRTGDAHYGIVAHPEKSLVNFNTSPCGVQIPQIFQTTWFPFCGLLINTQNLEVRKDRVRKDNVVANTLTVDTKNRSGKKMMRKSLISLKIQLKNILLDSSLNDRNRILQSLIECFQETAMKLHQYLMHLRNAQRPSAELLIKLIQQLIGYCFHILKERSGGIAFELSRPQVSHLAALAFVHVLDAKQSAYSRVLLWLGVLKTETEHSLGMDSKVVRSLLEKSSRALQHYVY